MHTFSIHLAEPTVFLRRSSDVTVSGRRRQVPDTPPSILRGILTLKLTTPMKIRNITVHLAGKSVTEWPEGIGPRGNQWIEEIPIISADAIIFDAKDKGAERSRRTRSLGPGVSTSAESDDEGEEDPYQDRTSRASSRSSRAPDRRTRRDRGHSVDQWGRHRFPPVEESARWCATPPYTPESSSHELPEEPGQALEVLRNALKATTHHYIPVPGEASDLGLSSAPPTRPATSMTRSRPQSMQMAALPATELSSSSSRALESHSGERLAGGSSQGQSGQVESPLPSPTGARRPSLSANGSFSRHSFAVQEELTPPATPQRPWDGLPMAPVVKKTKRFSFSAAWQDVKEILGRPSTRPACLPEEFAPDLRDHEPVTSPRVNATSPVMGKHEGSRKRDSSRGRDRTVVGKLGDVLGLDEDKHENWEEFRKGTYNWPVSFTIPADSPPSLKCPFGSVTYRIRAQVNRLGAFHPNLTASAEVAVVACPGEDDTEENESIIVEREWEQNLHYLIALSGKSFPIGGIIPLHLTLVPLSKVLVHRITAMLEERVSYYAHGRQESHHSPVHSESLIALRHPDKQLPLLPIVSDSVDAATSSPLAPYIDAQDPSEVAEQLLTLTGPWSLHFTLKVPSCSSKIHFSNKSSKAKVVITHTIKITLRVSKRDGEIDAKGKRKQYDIIVECPVQLLSCRCKPEWINLPCYSLFPMDRSLGFASCICQAGSHDGSSGAHHDMSFEMSIPARPGSLSPSHPPDAGSPASPAVDPEVSERNQQFARLVAGAESAAGETPPPYAG